MTLLVLGIAFVALALLTLVVPGLIVRRDQANAGSTEGLFGPIPDTIETTISTSDGAQLRVVERGSGQPLVLVHGLSLSHESWRYQLLDLADRFRVVAVDLRGHGASTVGDLDVGSEVFASDLAAVLEALDLRAIVLVGHSLGGTVVGQFLADHPDVARERVAGVVFAGTFAAAIAGEGRFRERCSRPLTKLTANAAGRRKPKEAPSTSAIAYVTARSPFGPSPRPEHVRLTMELSNQTDPQLVSQATIANLDYDVRADLGALDVPSLVVRGSHDRLSTARSTEQLEQALADPEVALLEDTGHLVMLEARKEFNQLVRRLADRTEETT